MCNPMKVWNDWFKLSLQAMQLAWEAQNVIALRVMRMASGGDRGHSEAHRMTLRNLLRQLRLKPPVRQPHSPEATGIASQQRSWASIKNAFAGMLGACVRPDKDGPLR